MTTGDDFDLIMAQLLGDTPPTAIGVGVSGGGDSVALMVLLAGWCAPKGIGLHVATVDHRLRPESRAEAEAVALAAQALGVTHDVLKWVDPSKRGNLQAKARVARSRLLRDWAGRRGIKHICLGHTRDDQAETVLLRLARGSGVDGLAAMRPARREGDVIWLRPLLTKRRADLRVFLRASGNNWVEDPSNGDLRFDRVKARALLAAPPLPGLDVDTLADTATRMQAASEVLSRVAHDATLGLLEVDRGEVLLDYQGLAALADDTRWRLLAEILCRVASNSYRPRLRALKEAEAQLGAGKRTTLHGCLCVPEKGRLRVVRELAALSNIRAPVPGVWDASWQIDGPTAGGQMVAALGEQGVRERPDWRRCGLSRAGVLASPAVWKNDMLVCAMLLDDDAAWRARLLWDKTSLCEGLLSH